MSLDLNPFTRDDGAYAPVGSAFTVTLGKMLDGGRDLVEDASTLPYVRAGNIQDGGLDLSEVNSMPFTPAESAALDLRAGDVLVVEGGAVGTCVVLEEDMPGWSFQKTVNRLRPVGDWSPSYVAYVLRAYRDAGIIDVVCNRSTIPHLTAEKLRALRIPAWESSRQVAIARYLDREAAQIDTLIAAQSDLIELLRERRATVIDRVVWAGFDDSAPTSPTDIDPVPTAPAHWRRLRNKNLLFESSDLSVGGEELLSVSHLTGITPRAEKSVTMTESEDLGGYRRVHVGELVINTMWAWMGALGVARVDGIVSPAYGVYRPVPGAEFDASYAAYDRHPLDEGDEWGDLASFRAAAGA